MKANDNLKACLKPLSNNFEYLTEQIQSYLMLTEVYYAGDLKNAPVTTIKLEFEIPIYKYSIATTGKGENLISKVERKFITTETIVVTQALASKSYQIVLDENFFAVEDDNQLPLLMQFVSQAVENKNLSDLTLQVKVYYFANNNCKIGEESFEVIYFPRLDPDLSNNWEANFAAPLLFINKYAYLELLKQFAGFFQSPRVVLRLFDEMSLLVIISALTDFNEKRPTLIKEISEELRGFVLNNMPGGSIETRNDALTLIQKRFETLYDFPLTIPEIKIIALGGKFTIKIPANSKIKKTDFSVYTLSAEYSVNGDFRILHYIFPDPEDLKIEENSVRFDFPKNPPIFRNCVTSISITVKGIDGSIVWERQFDPNNPLLDDIPIELNNIPITVPLQKRSGLTRLDIPPFQDKRLRGQVLELSKKCPLKDLTVLVQAKNDKDKIWRVVGAATTDGSGNFSMPYPFGIFTEAQAITSLTPNHPVYIPITEVRYGNQTISDDFLFLLVKDVDCPHSEKDEDCECHDAKKPSRLPDYADLIESDEYTQDIGGSCVNLSTPNRTLSEFNYQAIVRTSDPEVANYTLKKIDVPKMRSEMVPGPMVPGKVPGMVLGKVLGPLMPEVVDGVTPAMLEEIMGTERVFRSDHNNYINIIKIPKEIRDVMSLDSDDCKFMTSEKVAEAFNLIPLQIIASAFLPKIAIVSPGFAAQPQKVDIVDIEGVKANLKTTSEGQKVMNDIGSLLQLSGNPNDVDRALEIMIRILPIIMAGMVARGMGLGTTPKMVPGPEVDGWVPGMVPGMVPGPEVPGLVPEMTLDPWGKTVPVIETRYELVGEKTTRLRKPITLDNPVEWQDAPEAQKELSIYQAVTIATGHILHYKSLFKADGYSLGELIYSLPLAPGQKKQIVTFDASHTLQGAESQVLSQGERLAAGLVNERDIINVLGGNITESTRGSSSANTRGISAGLGVGVLVPPVGAVLGVAGGVANSNSSASQDSSREVSQFFGEKLRQAIMQNAESYRQLNASVVTTVQEGQRYGVTSEVVANHNHCHALTMMYFEVLRHYAIYQELSSVEECVFVPLLMTNFTTQNIYKWRDVLAPLLLPMPAETYLQPSSSMAGSGRQHPLLKAFDANERIKTNYANVDFPQGSYNEEQIRFIKGSMVVRVELERPKTPYDRIKSLPIISQTTATKEIDPVATIAQVPDMIKDAAIRIGQAAVTGGISEILRFFSGKGPAPDVPDFKIKTIEHQSLVRQAIFDAFMTLDANYETVPPAQCIRIVNFAVTISITVGPDTKTVSGLDFFQNDVVDKKLWDAYASILGYIDHPEKGPAALQMLDHYFKDKLISEWDDIFYNDIVPVVFNTIVSSINITNFSTDFTSATKYKGGERLMRLNLTGTTSQSRNKLPDILNMTSALIAGLGDLLTFAIEDLTISYSTAHYNGILFSGNLNNDLADGIDLYIPENSEEKRNPKKEDAYLVYKLIEHLNSNLEYYNKVLLYNLDPDRRYMLLDGFNIQIFNDFGLPFDEFGKPLPPRSLASVIKNDLITITGNSLVFPVAAGYKVSQGYITEETESEKDGKKRITLLDHYQPLTPIKPYRISIPTKGVFAEAIQGACNACEKIETDRLQDWNKFPNPDEPTAISPVTPPTVGITDWKAAFKDFAAPIVNIQNAPGTPEPGAGLAGLSELLGKSGVFKDITGLEGNQQNVIRTYLSNQENAKAFAQMAKDMAMQAHNTQNSDKILNSLNDAKNSGALNQADYNKLVKDHLQQQIDGGQTKRAEIERDKQSMPSPLTKAAVEAANQGKDVKAQRTDYEGTSESIAIGIGASSAVLAEASGTVPALRQTKRNDCWAVCATMMASWKAGQSLGVIEVLTAAGPQYLDIYSADTGLPVEEKSAFISAMGMVSEPPKSVLPREYVALLEAYGPLWITTDTDPVAEKGRFALHARVLTKISGELSDDGSKMTMTFIDPDPDTGASNESSESFADFIRAFEQAVSDTPESTPLILVIHFADRQPGVTEGGRPVGSHKTSAGATARLVPIIRTLTLTGTGATIPMVDEVPGLLIDQFDPFPDRLDLTFGGYIQTIGSPSAIPSMANLRVMLAFAAYQNPALNGEVVVTQPVQPNGRFEISAALFFTPGVTRPFRVSSLLTIEGAIIPTDVRRVLVDNANIDWFVSLIDDAERLTIVSSRLEFLARARKTYLTSSDFNYVLPRFALTEALFAKDSEMGMRLRAGRHLRNGVEAITISHVLIGIEGGRLQDPQPRIPVDRPDTLVTWAGDLGGALVRHLVATYYRNDPAAKTLDQYIAETASRADLIGDIDGVNLSFSYDREKSLADNLLAYYGGPARKRFSRFLEITEGNAGGRALSIEPGGGAPQLTAASKQFLSEQILAAAMLPMVRRTVLSSDTPPEKRFWLGPEVEAALTVGSTEVQKLTGMFATLLERGLASELP